MTLNLPIILTYFRLLLVLVILGAYMAISSPFLIVAVLFGIASFTDWLDGYIARKLNQVTSFGGFLDPVADKILIATTMFLLVDYFKHSILTLICALIVIREIGMSALRQWAAEQHLEDRVKVNNYGKLKTVVQQLALFILLLQAGTGYEFFYTPGLACLIFACFLTWYSFYVYIISLKSKKN